MKILALRVADFRLFTSPVALEGFASGVTIVAGANETGKSTLFHALEAAFLLPHSKTGAALEFLRPRRGGDPVVEVDFEVAGKRFRIAKRFGRGKSANLSNLDTGSILARAAEAEEHLARLVGANGEGPGRAGLVWVRQQRALLAPDPDLDPETGKAKPRGETQALNALLGDEIVEAAGSEKADEVAARVKKALLDLVTEERGGARKNGPYARALETRDQALQHLARVRAAVAASEARLKRIADLAALVAAPHHLSADGDEDARIADAEKALALAAGKRARRDQLLGERDRRRLEAENAAQALAACEQAAARRAERGERLAAVRALEAEIEAHAQALNADAATPARLKRLLELERGLAIAEANRGEAGARVTFALDAGGEGKVKADGAPVERRAAIDVIEEIDIAIDGIGVIRVTVAGKDEAVAARARAEAARQALTQGLEDMQAASLDEAKAAGERRQARLAELDTARARLSALAPKGVAALTEELAKLTRHGEEPRPDAIRKAAEDAALVARAADRAYDEARADAPDDVALRKLSSDLSALKDGRARRQNEAARLTLELERLKGEQAGFDDEGRAGELDSATQTLERAESEVARCEREIAALKLLLVELSGATEGIKTRYFEPVSRAILPYLLQVFPEATVDLAHGFALKGLTRAGEREDFETLSDGTREQLAVLARMGFARVLAERGASVPLVLDDPLVYSDDARLAAMCRALEDAGKTYQVILFTCRESAFQKLSGRRLVLQSWRPEA